MTFFDLSYEMLLVAVFGGLLLLAVFSAWAMWFTQLIRGKMVDATNLAWPIALSFSVGALMTVGNPEPHEELILLAIAHVFVWHLLWRRDRATTPNADPNSNP